MGEIVPRTLANELIARLAAAGRAWLILVGAAIAIPAAAGESPTHVTEPPHLWTGPMVSDTPATLKGAQVIDAPDLERLIDRTPLMIDVGPADRKPDNLSPGAIWKPIHRSIPGAVWFPGAGMGDLPAKSVETLLRRVLELTKGDKGAPVVIFCQPRCWGSWNVGKRLVEAGYTSVHWFPAGVAGWQERGQTKAIEPDAGWMTTSVANAGGSTADD